MEKSKIDELKAAVYWLAVNYQQNFYEVSSDWNKYKIDEHQYLKNYIGYALYGPPEYEELCGDTEDGAYIYKENGAMQLIDTIYDKIVEHGTQMTEEKEVLCSILYTCIYDEGSLPNCDEHKLHELVFIRPVFKIQKNIKEKKEVKLKAWYIDTEARVYKNWNDFLKNNNMPTCIMIAPKDGIYQADLKEVWSDKTSTVWVETHSNNATRKYTSAVDVASTLVNFGCVGIGIAAMFNPISAPVAIAGAVGGAVSGVWGGGRAIGELVDRGSHDQSISVINKHALPAWLGVAGSTLGLAASSGSALLSRAIRTGTSVGKSAQIAHDAIMISNLFINSVGVGYNSLNMVQKYRETGEVSAKDIFFLTAHVLFICNSAVKMRLASEIIKSDQNQILKDYEDSLRSNRHRKEFRRLVRNTGTNIADKVHRNEQIIRSLTKISNKDEFFATMVQNRKIFATAGTQLSFADGQVQVNGVTLISPSTFASMSKDNLMALINQGSESNPSMQASTSMSSGTFMSANVLKAGMSRVRDFYVQKSVSSSVPLETHTTEYKGIINELQNLPEKSKIFGLLLQTGLCIAKKICQRGNYTEDDLLADTTNFIWNVAKLNVANHLPGINIYDAKYQDIIMRIVKATHDYVKANCSEWANAFRKYMNQGHLDSGIEEELFKSSDNIELCRHLSNESQNSYNDIEMMDPAEVMSLPIEVSTIIVQESLESTGSKMNEDTRPPKEMLKLCETELSDFFMKHPTSLDFKLSELPNELKGILLDLKDFERKNIIFYKLLIIAINITQGAEEEDAPLKKDTLVNVMQCLWIFVNMNFSEIMPNVCMFNGEYEGFVMNIVIRLYKYQITQPKKWLSAFHEYRAKFGKQ
ncbi:uncharacterized protein LOC100678274 [Nasonia vitripennis]|uniref:DUF4781 domain-containing protein n=1 Tax=Nasonia vitripennis TaxID=7425 RepID=A0A7M7H835_NASVI|nr:uncharacterized protein LOC100678274 [Nasonia vitripennis]